MVSLAKHCIYLITNKINGNQYVGQASNVKNRYYQHFYYQKDERQVIDKAINKYGKENFDFKIIHNNIETEDIDEWEMYYINEIYNTYKGKGYNCHIGGNCQSGVNNPMYGVYGEDNPRYGQKHSEKSREKISRNHANVNGKNNPMYGLKGFENPNFKLTLKVVLDILELKINKVSSKEIAEIFNIDSELVSNICYGRHSVCKQLKIDFSIMKDIYHDRIKLTLRDVCHVKEMVKEGKSSNFIANEMNVSKPLVDTIRQNRYSLSKFINKDGDIKKEIKEFLEYLELIFNKSKNNIKWAEENILVLE